MNIGHQYVGAQRFDQIGLAGKSGIANLHVLRSNAEQQFTVPERTLQAKAPCFKNTVLNGVGQGDTEVTIACCGAVVAPGDMIYADEDGILVVRQ